MKRTIIRVVPALVTLVWGFLILLLAGSPALGAGQLQDDPAPTAEATPTPEPAWAPPVNLSRSGAASDPQVIVSSDQMYVIWQDAVDGFYYARGTDGGWSGPAAVDAPFSLRTSDPEAPVEPTFFRPHLFADNSGRIHAFWINDEGAMFHSSVAANNFGDLEEWQPAQLVAEGILTLDASLDVRGVMHLSYVHSISAGGGPPGIYYRQLTADAEEWSAPIQLYQSDYFRSLAAEAAHLEIATSETGQVFVVWDHSPLEKVFLARSDNGGRDWQPAQEVDSRKPTDSSNAVSPNDVLVSVQGSNVLVLWTAGHEGINCAPYYQSSADGGITWEPVKMLSGLPGCPEEGSLLVSGEGYILFMAAVLGQAHLVAWDGAAWSAAQAQPELATFMNPETARQVNLTCYRPAMAGGQLFVVGCDGNGGQDIWVTSRPLGGAEGWFPPPPVWQAPQQVLSSESGIDGLELVTDSNGRQHAFWLERNDTVIHHSVLDDGRWSRPVPIADLPSATLSEPSVSVSASGRLLLTWSDAQTGQIYFSQADAASALLVSDWSVPQALPVSQPAAGWPDLVAGGSGRIYLAYTISINEARGVYVTWSDDSGESWSEPVQVFDGVKAGWSVVGSPQLAWTLANRLHLVWTRHTAPGGSGPLGLFYAHSGDGGATWSEPEAIAEAPVTWSEVVAAEGGTVHLLWQERRDGQISLQHSVSQDNGDTWSLPTIVSRSEGQDVVVDVVAGGAGQLNLLQGAVSGLEHWHWDGARWVNKEGVETKLAAWDGLAAVSASETLAVVYTGRAEAGGQQQPEALFFTSRVLEGDLVGPQMPLTSDADVPTSSTAPVLAPTSGSTALTGTATVAATVEADSQVPTVESPGRSLNWPQGLVFEILPAMLIVLLVFAVRFYAVRTRN